MSNQKTLKAMRDALQMTKQRCYSPKCRDYPYYGGRGIKICQRWLDSFDNFVEDMGIRPEGMTLERRENDGNYEKSNCVWATRVVQSANRRITITLTLDGVTKTLSEWSKETGIPYHTLKARKQRLGYSDRDVLTKPVKCGEVLPGVKIVRRKPDMSKVPRGRDSALIALSPKQVETARALYKSQGHTYTSLSKVFGVSIETMSCVIQHQKAYSK